MSTKSLRPQQWDDYIGQDKLKERLITHIEAATADRRMVDHILLCGPPGCGKTSLAALVAKARYLPFHQFLVSTSTKGADIDEMISNGHIVFLDEIHRLKPVVQEELLMPLEDGKFVRHGVPEELDLPVTVIAATTEPDKVIKPLYDRFVIKPPFEPYSDAQMADIVKGMGLRLPEPIQFTEEAALTLGKAAAGSPRQAKSLVFAARDCPGQPVSAILQLAGITPEGLTLHHIEYLKVLRRNSRGVAGAKVLSASLGMPEASIMDLEQALIRLDHIEYSPGGRALKPLGRKYIYSHLQEAKTS